MAPICKSIGCWRHAEVGLDFCLSCSSKGNDAELTAQNPNHYKLLGDLTEIDPFGVNHLFQIKDPSGCLQFAISKLLMTGTNQNRVLRDVKDARDALTRWLQLNKQEQEITR